MKLKSIALVILGFLFCASHVLAAQGNEIIVGVGYGLHSFNEKDDFRKTNDNFSGADEVDSAGGPRLFIDWFIAGNFGFGVLVNTTNVSRTFKNTYDDGGGPVTEDIEQDWNIMAKFLTLSFTPFGRDDFITPGLYVGVGASDYKSEFTIKVAGEESNVDFSSNGPATTLGLYVDFGASEGFGARVGLQNITTDLPKIKDDNGDKIKVDASGNTLHADIRWAF